MKRIISQKFYSVFSENFVIIGTEITAKIREIPVKPNALKLTQASVDSVRQAISFARAVTTNIEIHTMDK